MKEYKVYSKINFFLDIINNRSDGYHDIKSVFCTVSLFDTVQICKADNPKNRFYDSSGNLLKRDNLICKAAFLIEKYNKNNNFFDFYFTKKIPISGGMGGGSADAAFILRFLNSNCGINFSNEKLMKLGSSIGADIPFFIKGGLAEVSGVGEKVKPLSGMPSLLMLAVIPDIGVSTITAYNLIDKKKLNFFSDKSKKMYKNLINGLQTNDYNAIKSNIYNKFEAVIFPEYPELETVKDKIIESGADRAFMSGSGSTMIGIYRSESALDNGAKFLNNLNYEVKIIECVI